jgi:hypothetical protein
MQHLFGPFEVSIGSLKEQCHVVMKRCGERGQPWQTEHKSENCGPKQPFILMVEFIPP